MKKNERYFIIGLLILVLLFWGIITLLRPHNYGKICITAGGIEFGTYSLSENQIISIGETNICEISNGKVSMTHADCPDQFCIRQGSIDSSGGMIVCLPNKITIEGVKEDISDTGVDGIS